MQIKSAALLASLPALLLGAAMPALAQEGPQKNGATAPVQDSPSPSVPPARVLTGKERLGGKWMDEQRVDNCKVPLDKRGTKRRPDTCPSTASN